MTDKMGGPAFPVLREFYSHNDSGNIICGEGMTLWDWYAAHGPFDADWIEGALVRLGSVRNTGDGIVEQAANLNAAYADAMLAERAKRMEQPSE